MAIITVSRGSMSGGMAFAQCLARKLRYRCVAREVLVEAAANIGISEELLLGKIEKSAGLWERLTANRRLYLAAVQSALADECADGDLVYHGHAGHLLLKGLPTLLKVRLIAPMAMRVHAVMEKQQLTYDGARDYIRHVDQERVRWTRFVYGVDWRDPANYDVVVNLADMSVDSACAMVTAVVQLPVYRTSAEVRKKFADFALSCRVKLALARHAEARAINFDVAADGGRVEVLGEVPGGCLLMKQAGPTEEQITPIVAAVQGVKGVRVKLRRFAEGTQA